VNRLVRSGLTAALFLAASAMAFPPRGHAGTGTEWCLAGVCLGRTEQDLAGRYGAGRLFPGSNPFEHCYQARGKSVYVTALLDDEDPARPITAVLLSGETVCRDAATARVGPDRAGCRGVRLFDPVEKLSTVGAEKRQPKDKGYPWDGSPSEVSQFDYRCEPEKTCSVMASAFTRGGTIIAVSIWEPDC
jgi:hypothetical protein